MLKIFKYPLILLLLISITACQEDDSRSEDEEQNKYEGCCSVDPVFGPNVNNLNQFGGDIEVTTIVTQNGDGFNDALGIRNIDLYPNHTVTIFNSDNQQVYETSDYSLPENVFPGYPQDENAGAEGFPNGTYRYLIIIEDEQTFKQSGSFCMYTWADPEPNFQGCNLDGFDPIIVNPPN